MYLLCCGGLFFLLISSGYLLILRQEGTNKIFLIPLLLLDGIAFWLYRYYESCCKKKALKLLTIALRHLQQVLTVTEGGKYCLDIIQRSRVVQRYLKLADEEILSVHLKECVKKVVNGKNTDRQLQEIMLIFRKGQG
ncbi:metal-sensing transcriptional repressor [Candidatus Daviesbacteria bacterium]|nr:metal-sensing transcriptional repressor [Candidatus Daviesbacteria bacterium]